MTRALLFVSVLLVGAVSIATAHRIEGPEEIIAEPGGSFEFEFTYVAPEVPFVFGSLHWGPLDNVAGSDAWADGFCELGDGGWSYTDVMSGQLMDAAQSGTTLIEVDACDQWGHIELVTTVLPNPITAVDEPDVVTRLWAYPNPMRASVAFELVGDGAAGGDRVVIFDAAGKRVRMVSFAGSRARWDARTETGEPAAPGVYFYRIDRPDARVGRLVVID